MEIREYKQVINISEELMVRINELLSHYPADKKKSAMLPVLHVVQDAHDNWLSRGLMDKVAEILEVKPIEVYEVVTFYSMFNRKPIAKYMFEFCRTACCGLRGGDNLMDYTCRKLGVKPGEITSDGMFSVVGVECLGACGYGPMLQLGDNFHEQLTEEKIDTLIEDCKQGKVNLY
ncbi:MAG: NADH-quinone oxidoreductase subunit NuoE [Dysgonomonas sp.]